MNSLKHHDNKAIFSLILSLAYIMSGIKTEKNKKFNPININNFYQGVSNKSNKTNVIRHVGLQPLGKVGINRRLPAKSLQQQDESSPVASNSANSSPKQEQSPPHQPILSQSNTEAQPTKNPVSVQGRQNGELATQDKPVETPINQDKDRQQRDQVVGRQISIEDEFRRRGEPRRVQNDFKAFGRQTNRPHQQTPQAPRAQHHHQPQIQSKPLPTESNSIDSKAHQQQAQASKNPEPPRIVESLQRRQLDPPQKPSGSYHQNQQHLQPYQQQQRGNYRHPHHHDDVRGVEVKKDHELPPLQAFNNKQNMVSPNQKQQQPPRLAAAQVPILTDKELENLDNITRQTKWASGRITIDYDAKLNFSDDEDEQQPTVEGPIGDDKLANDKVVQTASEPRRQSPPSIRQNNNIQRPQKDQTKTSEVSIKTQNQPPSSQHRHNHAIPMADISQQKQHHRGNAPLPSSIIQISPDIQNHQQANKPAPAVPAPLKRQNSVSPVTIVETQDQSSLPPSIPVQHHQQQNQQEHQPLQPPKPAQAPLLYSLPGQSNGSNHESRHNQDSRHNHEPRHNHDSRQNNYDSRHNQEPRNSHNHHDSRNQQHNMDQRANQPEARQTHDSRQIHNNNNSSNSNTNNNHEPPPRHHDSRHKHYDTRHNHHERSNNHHGGHNSTIHNNHRAPTAPRFMRENHHRNESPPFSVSNHQQSRQQSHQQQQHQLHDQQSNNKFRPVISRVFYRSDIKRISGGKQGDLFSNKS